MIDLRSDTLSKPSKEMRKAMYEAETGDDGRIDSFGRSEDPTVRRLEDLSAEISGHEAALFCNSGTMANYIAILTHEAQRGDSILTDRSSHISRSEKGLFMEHLFGLTPEFYPVDDHGIPDSDAIENIVKNGQSRLLLLENTHNAYGGTCISVSKMKKLCAIARLYGAPVHLDGARIFNAAAYFDIDVKALTSPADSMMFCLSKGLGAPVGSMLCGDRDFIYRARKLRKILGGSMRQAGVIAAAGIVALEDAVEKSKVDHENALYLARNINTEYMKIDVDAVQTNIVIADISSSGRSAAHLVNELEQKGLRLQAISDTKVRMVTYKDISAEEIKKAVSIINNYFNNKYL